jgi:chromosome partitioning protein
MIIVCDNCNTRFRLADEAVPKGLFKAKCAKCEHIFTVTPDAPATPVKLDSSHIVEDHHHKIITICNQKGGVAKTSSCINIGQAMAAMGKKVLLIDFDVQANLSELLGCSGERCFFDVMDDGGDQELPKAILKVGNNLWCLPSNSRMALLSKKYLHTKGFEKILRRHIKRIHSFFDFVLIDTPPSLDFFTINALMASDFAIIPTQAEYLAVKGVKHVENIIDVIHQKTGHALDYKVLITMYDTRNTAARVVRGNLRKGLGEKIFEADVVHDCKVQESQIVGKAVGEYAADSEAARQYAQIAKEIIGNHSAPQGRSEGVPPS